MFETEFVVSESSVSAFKVKILVGVCTCTNIPVNVNMLVNSVFCCLGNFLALSTTCL